MSSVSFTWMDQRRRFLRRLEAIARITGKPMAPRNTPIIRAPRNQKSSANCVSPSAFGANPVFVNAIAE